MCFMNLFFCKIKIIHPYIRFYLFVERGHIGFFGIKFVIFKVVSLSCNYILNKVRFKPVCHRFADFDLFVLQLKFWYEFKTWNFFCLSVMILSALYCICTWELPKGTNMTCVIWGVLGLEEYLWKKISIWLILRGIKSYYVYNCI